MMTKQFFSTNMKLADLISANYHLILILPRLGISLGFEDKSVEDVCRNNHVDPELFILICNIYSFSDYIPDNKKITSININQLVSYLLASHQYYIQERIPHIEQHLHHIANRVEPKYGTILKKFFDDYKSEVFNHFKYEEELVFPHLKQLCESNKHQSYCIEEFTETHSNIEDKLGDLTQIIYKYLPGNILPEESIELVFDVMELSSDLNKHTLIEEKILTPYIETLERSVK